MECVATVVGRDSDAAYALVTDAEQIETLQQHWRVYGMMETSQRLRLSLEEVSVGFAKGFLRLENADGRVAEEITRQLNGEGAQNSWTISPRRRARLRVFRDLWERGYVVTFGSKFGADFLIYKDDPKRSHAVALIVVKDYEEEFARVDVVSFCRVAKMVKKQLLFACVRPADRNQRCQHDNAVAPAEKDDVVYISLTHALLVSRQDESAE